MNYILNFHHLIIWMLQFYVWNFGYNQIDLEIFLNQNDIRFFMKNIVVAHT